MKNIFTSIWFLGLIIAIPTVILIPDIFSKYKISLMSRSPESTNEYRIYYKDLDGNGNKEKIISFKNNVNQLAFQHFNKNGGIVNQLNFKYSYSPSLSHIFFGDVNQNNLQEVYGFTLKNDSLYLSWVEPYPSQNEVNNHQFISKIGTYNNGEMNFAITHFEITDVDNDKKNEILFSIEAGYSLTPRVIVLFQPENGVLLKSQDIGINANRLVINDLDNDGKTEIIASNASSYNLENEEGEPMIDDKPWLQVFDSQLNPFFKAVPFSKGLVNFMVSFVIIEKDSLKKITAFQTNTSLPANQIFTAYHFDIHGNLIDSTTIPEIGKHFNSQIFQIKDGFIIYNGEQIFYLTNNFEIEKQKELPTSNRIYKIYSPQSTITKYYSINSNLNELILFSEQFDQLNAITYNNELIREVIFDTDRPQNYFLVHTNQNEYYYLIQKNILYFIKYPLYVSIYLLWVLFIWFIQFLREKQLKEKLELKNQLREMELKSLNSQMDPHFMFNSFTTVASLLKKGEHDNAYDVFIKFTKLVRSNFDFSNKLLRPLKDELFIISSFLEINKMRFKDKLEYAINVDTKVSQNMLVPKMMLQTHVENALKHGIAKSPGKGILQITITRENKFVTFRIEDNGIGRKNAKILRTTGTQQGLKLLQTVYDRQNRTNTLKIKQQFIDLTDKDGSASGTLVKIKLPVNLKEEQ